MPATQRVLKVVFFLDPIQRNNIIKKRALKSFAGSFLLIKVLLPENTESQAF